MPLFGKQAPNAQGFSGAAGEHSNPLPPSLILPPVPHPSPHSKLALIPTPDGLVITPAVITVDKVDAARISWGRDGGVQSVNMRSLYRSNHATVTGIVGIIRLFNAAYLLVIADRTRVGTFLDDTRTVYCIKNVISVPLDEKRCDSALKLLLKRQTTESALTDDDTDLEDDPSSATDDESASIDEFEDPPTPLLSSSLSDLVPQKIAPRASAPLMARRISFWRKVARRQKPLPEPLPPLVDQVSQEQEEAERAPLPKVTVESSDTAPSSVASTPLKSKLKTQQERLIDVEKKVVRECIRLVTQGTMYFSYDFDLTRGLQRKSMMNSQKKQQNTLLTDLAGPRSTDSVPVSSVPIAEPNAHLPLWRRVDRKYWWNRNLIAEFVEAGLHSYILPIMNGFVEMSIFHLPIPTAGEDPPEEGSSVPVDFMIFSRRSCERPGLRYQRRGIDDNGNVANFVETETIVALDRDGRRNVFAYTQIRGSIPLFWSQPQPGLALKPIPKLERSLAESSDVMKKHFQKLSSYGPISIINLAELTGKESVVTLAYRELAQGLNMKTVKYTEFDFHHECKGMKYENISKLVTALQSTFASQGFFWLNDNEVLSQQNGVYRTNCIDCLDRTNVVQSAFSRHVLEQQLQASALLAASGKTEQEVIFNTVWANNGDAISRSYAGTSALKGDFTRTGKRDINGMLNDGMNSLARLYSSAFADYFTQAVIDFAMGNRTLSVFSEFLEKLQSTDPGEMFRLSKIRAAAIETCASHVLSEGETMVGGWTLFSPSEMNVKMGKNFEEKILLLSGIAIYISSYDYSLDKVVIVTRIPLGDITGIQKGAYILSTLQEAARDPAMNYGLLITWRATHQTSRITSYSLRNKPESLDMEDDSAGGGTVRPALARSMSSLGKGFPRETQFAAFKGLASGEAERPRTLSALPPQGSCKSAVDVIVDSIVRACKSADSIYAGRNGFVVEEDIISLLEAQRETTVYAKLEYYLKRRLWL